MESVFTLYDFIGQPVSYWGVKEIEVPKPQIEKAVGHHIVVIDRSGSMYGEMEDTKRMVEQVFTVEEFHDANLLLSLISYSSSGDTTVHFSRVPVQEVNQAKSPYIDQLRSIKATCLTCASGALHEASQLIGDETTVISLHTDGWFNDKSPTSEKKEIDGLLKKLAKNPKVMVNTIAYRTSSDFNYLSQIANNMSGSCVLAKDVKQVYTALHDTTALLAGRVTPAIPLGIDGADWQIALNYSKRKVNGAATDIIIRGVSEEDRLKIYRFSKLSQSTYNRSSLPQTDRCGKDGQTILAAFGRTKLAEGRINEAKYALVTMRNKELLQRHYLALSSSQLTDLALDLEAIVVGDKETLSQENTYGFDNSKPDLATLFRTLNEANHSTDSAKSVFVDMLMFNNDYKRRGVKRLEGEWVDGRFVPNTVQLTEKVDLNEDPLVQVQQFDVNTSEATINMMTSQPAELVKSGKRIYRVAGKALDLQLFRSHTIVADGQPNVSRLRLNISSPAVFKKLQDLGFIGADVAFDHTACVEIDLTQFPVVPLKQSDLTPPSLTALEDYARNLVRHKILKAYVPEETKATYSWSPEQLVELRSHNLTPNLAFSPPTTNPYTDKVQAASAGSIDSYTRYSISLGTKLATDLRQSLWSGNEYFARRYSVKIEGSGDVDKEGFEKRPKLATLWEGKGQVSLKTLSSRTKLTALDAFVFPLYEEFMAKYGTPFEGKEESVKAEMRALEEAIGTFEASMSQLALAIGSTGLIPDHWDAKIRTAEDLKAEYGDIDVPRAHADSTFFEVDGVLIGVHAEVAWYSTDKGVQEAEALEQMVHAAN